MVRPGTQSCWSVRAGCGAGTGVVTGTGPGDLVGDEATMAMAAATARRSAAVVRRLSIDMTTSHADRRVSLVFVTPGRCRTDFFSRREP
jgi:hypothetical protein